MRKFLSFLFTLLIIGGIGFLIWKHPEFCQKQVDKIRAVWYVYQGDKALKKLKIQKAINFYTRAVALYPEHYGAWYNLGNIYVVYEDYYSAVDAYEKAFEINPKMIVARMDYGIVSAEKLGDFDGAIDQYNKILNTKRTLITIPFVYSNRRSYKMNKGIAYYNRGVAYKQKSIYHDYGYEERRRYIFKALDSYKKAVKILKKDYDARYNLALTYHIIGDYKQAGLNYCDAIELDPMKYEAHYNLAVLLRHLKYYNESLDELEKASSLIASSSKGISVQQRYIFDVMNEVTRTILASGNNELIDKLFYEDPDGETPSKITYINGRLVMSDKLDKAILKNLAVCEARHIIQDDLESTNEDFYDILYEGNALKDNNNPNYKNILKEKEEKARLEEEEANAKEEQEANSQESEENEQDNFAPIENSEDLNNLNDNIPATP